MNTIFNKSFAKSIAKIKDKDLKQKILVVITQIDAAQSLLAIPNVKKMTGFDNFYRIRIGSYRIGFSYNGNDTVELIIVAHRKDIYKLFP